MNQPKDTRNKTIFGIIKYCPIGSENLNNLDSKDQTPPNQKFLTLPRLRHFLFRIEFAYQDINKLNHDLFQEFQNFWKNSPNKLHLEMRYQNVVKYWSLGDNGNELSMMNQLKFKHLPENQNKLIKKFVSQLKTQAKQDGTYWTLDLKQWSTNQLKEWSFGDIKVMVSKKYRMVGFESDLTQLINEININSKKNQTREKQISSLDLIELSQL